MISVSQYVPHLSTCIELALDAVRIGKPHVGAILLNEAGMVVGSGVKYRLGDTSFVVHAERAAIDSVPAYSNFETLTLVTTLEPCTP